MDINEIGLTAETELAELTELAGAMAECNQNLEELREQRDTLIRALTAANVGATTVARAADMSTAMVYKIVGRQ